jgi:acyl-CoA oxidase
MEHRITLISNHLSREKSNKNFRVNDPIQFLKLDELIPADLNQRRKDLRQMLEKEIAPILNHYIEKAEFPLQILPKLKDLFGLTEQKYGCRKLTNYEKALNVYELARIDCSLATFYVASLSLVIFTIEKLGSEEQKAIYLPKLCDLELIGGWGLTEPDTGSDASSLTTTATPTDGGFILNGSKRWIGNAPISDILIIWARNTTTKQIEGFIVPSKHPGVNIVKIQRKLGLRMVQNGDIYLNNVKVGINLRLEKATNFNNGVNVVLNSSRTMLPWMATGIMSGIYEVCIKHLVHRVQFKVPLASFQINQEKLVRILGHYQSSFLLSWRILELVNSDQINIGQASLVKGWSSLIGREAARLGRELLGGNGVLIENYVIKALADMEIVYTFEGSYDINALVAGREITGVSAFKSNFKKV